MNEGHSSFLIGQRRVGFGAPCFVIAEAGSNHDGKLEQAYRLIDLAAEAGADAVKFQIFKASALYPPTAGKSDYLGDQRSIFDIIRAMEMPPDWLPLLSARSKERGIAFMASAFDEASVDLLATHVDAFKVASYEMTHAPLLQYTARKGKPIIFSTGTASLVEVSEAIETVRAAGNESMVVLQCTAAYPTPLENVDARSLVTIREVFGVPTGLSDHSRDPIVAPMTATALGATVIEKHYTLSNRLPGPDHPFAIEPNELIEMVRRIREVERALGMGEKKPSHVEAELRTFARRTVFTTTAVAAGDVVSHENTSVLRAGKQAHGLPPRDYPAALGRKFLRALDAYATVTAADVELGACESPVTLRIADESDMGRVWVWNNEPDARAASIQSARIPWVEHQRWFVAKLRDPDTTFWIVCSPQWGAIGSVRVERHGHEDVISLALTPGARGRGIGSAVIADAMERRRRAGIERPVVAFVKLDHVASARAFVRAGFVLNERRNIDGVSVDVYVHRSNSR
jgi:N,N'-diacetyllegionaminate synthase